MTGKQNATERPQDEANLDASLNEQDFERGYGAILARRARAATGLSQAAFAERYGIPAGSLRDWEQGRRTPDAATRSYLRVIARMPGAVAKALAAA